jgi:diguanylate cyclase (GGDEF)-like protein
MVGAIAADAELDMGKSSNHLVVPPVRRQSVRGRRSVATGSSGDATPGPAQKEPLSVLIVEDSPDYALLVEQMLRMQLDGDVDCRVVDTVAAAGGALRDGAPDCVLLDLSLPGTDGLQTLRQVCQVAPEVPIVVLSGHDEERLAVVAVREGAQDYLVKGRADGQSIVRAIRFAIERKRAELELTHRALHDELTGLPNRVLLIDRVERALSRIDRGSRWVAVLFVDLNGFKHVNDTFGHAAGDALLAVVGERLSSMLRASDTVARFGGDEFVMVCEHVSFESQAIEIAGRLRDALAQPVQFGGDELSVHASVGIAMASDGFNKAEELISIADQAMFRAKETGAAFEVVTPETAESQAVGGDLNAELRRAAARGQFALHYQPQVDLRSGRTVGVEALLRWQHPERGLLVADEFIPVAEMRGLMVPIGNWVIEEVCRQFAAWRQHGVCDENFTVGINVSPHQLDDPMLVGFVAECLRRFGIAPDRVCLEITERVVAADPALGPTTLRALKGLGVQVALDDFGAGQSSLGTLAEYPVEVVKIDRSFVAALSSGVKARRLFAAVVTLSRALEMTVVAEGIETAEEMRYVAELGCDLGQGFHVGRPQAAPDVASLLSRFRATDTRCPEQTP